MKRAIIAITLGLLLFAVSISFSHNIEAGIDGRGFPLVYKESYSSNLDNPLLLVCYGTPANPGPRRCYTPPPINKTKLVADILIWQLVSFVLVYSYRRFRKNT
jgi:hypothetical protein